MNRYVKFCTFSFLMLSFQQTLAAPLPAAGFFYPGSNPKAAANILGFPQPQCGESVTDLVQFSTSAFTFDPITAGAVVPLETTEFNVHGPACTWANCTDPSQVKGELWGGQWYFINYYSNNLSFNTSTEHLEVMAYSQADDFYRYLRDDLGVTQLPHIDIILDRAGGDGPLSWPNGTFGSAQTQIWIPSGSIGGCNNTVVWLEDGDVMPHEIGGHILTGLTYHELAEPIGDYWGLAATWHPTENPDLLIGDWINVQFNNDNVFLRDLTQTAISYPYGLIDSVTPRAHHNNGQVFAAALWDFRVAMQAQFDSGTGAKIADYLVYLLSQNLDTVNTDSSAHLFEAARDKLLELLEILKATPDDGSYRDNYKLIDRYLLIEAFNQHGIGRYPTDPFFDSQVALHNRGGNTTDKQFHPLRDSDGSVIGFQTTTDDIDIDAPEAWAIQTGRLDVVVSVIDTGVQYQHPEFGFEYRIDDVSHALTCPQPDEICSTGNLWVNEAEFNGVAGQDDDPGPPLTGQIDDFIGWNFLMDSNIPTKIPPSTAFYPHGTKVASVAAAPGGAGTSSIGMAGVCWNCSLLSMGPAQYSNGFFGPNSIDAYAKGIRYSADHGAAVINGSWALASEITGGDYLLEDNNVLFNALGYAAKAGVVYISAAGNSGQFSPVADDSDLRPVFPQTTAHQNIINVTAIDANGEAPVLASDPTKSAYLHGKYTVDLAGPSPGMAVAANPFDPEAPTYVNGFNATSAAAPVVSGAVALLLSEEKDRIDRLTARGIGYRTLTLGEIRYLLLTSVDPVPSLAGKTVSGGRLNAHGLLLAYRDTDVDGYADVIENLFGTDIGDSLSFPDLSADADGDGLSNADELGYGSIPIPISPGEKLTGKLYPIYLDVTGELSTTATVGGFPPTPTDTDGDGVSDAEEVAYGGDPASPYSVINNLLDNPSIEEGTSAPQSWWTIDGVTRVWATDAAHTGTRSLKLDSTVGTGPLVVTSSATIATGSPTRLTIGGWSKADSVSLNTTGRYGLALYIQYVDGSTEQLRVPEIAFREGTHDWERVQYTADLGKEVLWYILEASLTGDATGTVWFDDLYVSP